MKPTLVTLHEGQIKSGNIELICYPDGQQNVKLDLEKFPYRQPLLIKCSLRNFSDLEILVCILAAAAKVDLTIYKVEFYYLFGQRADRAFEPGMPNYFRDIVARIINAYIRPYVHVEFLMAHNIAAFQALRHNDHVSSHFGHPDFFKSILIGGDESQDCFRPITCHFKKVRAGRDILVHLVETDLKAICEQPTEHQLLVVDDLCDAGGTFIVEAAYLRERFPGRRIALAVVHGLFTKGIDHVAQHFDHIYTTNSYQEIAHPKVTTIKVI